MREVVTGIGVRGGGDRNRSEGRWLQGKQWFLLWCCPCLQDDYSHALIKLHQIVGRAIEINSAIKFEVFIHKVDGLSDDRKIGTCPHQSVHRWTYAVSSPPPLCLFVFT